MENLDLVKQLVEFGFTEEQATLALILSYNNLELAANIASENSIEKLRSMVDEMEEESGEEEPDVSAMMFGNSLAQMLQDN